MAYDLTNALIIGISSRALFDLEAEARIYERLGPVAYRRYQLDHEDEVLRPGTAFALIRGLLGLNQPTEPRRVEVIIVSHNNPETGLRVFHSVSHYGLDITRAAFVGNDPLVPYLKQFRVDLYLSAALEDAQAAIDADIPAAVVYRPPNEARMEVGELRIAFDADAVLFSDESEAIFRARDLAAFLEHERDNARIAMNDGPFARLFRKLGTLNAGRDADKRAPLRVAIVTARNSPAHERVIRTLRAWGVEADAAFFLGGLQKAEVLEAFGAHMFFDDQETHLAPASVRVACALVPYKSNSILRTTATPAPPSGVSSDLPTTSVTELAVETSATDAAGSPSSNVIVGENK